MDRSEQLALEYLQSLGLGDIIYEPDGQTTPDFVIDGRIAVEVRRLNQNFETPNGHTGLEVVEAPILRFVETLLPRYGPAPEGRGWWISYDFRRPVDWKAVKSALPKALAEFKAAPSPSGADMHLTGTFKLEIRPAGIAVEHLFMLGGYADYDAGGFVAGEIIRNLNLCVAEKAAKISHRYAHYAEWWLVLPDYIGPDLNSEERSSIGQHVNLQAFSCVILIHPRVPSQALILSR
ncbi:MAG: hypothetical protein K9G59_04155 [Caulobacter sp.]|nr:hypothetical protein [Caulobacter sp.]